MKHHTLKKKFSQRFYC